MHYVKLIYNAIDLNERESPNIWKLPELWTNINLYLHNLIVSHIFIAMNSWVSKVKTGN